jgi:hypothetical protein
VDDPVTDRVQVPGRLRQRRHVDGRIRLVDEGELQARGACVDDEDARRL